MAELNSVLSYKELPQVLNNCVYIIQIKSNKFHAVSRTQQGRQRKPSVKTLRSPLSAEFWMHCVFSETQRLVFALEPERRNDNMNVNKHFISSSGDWTYNQSILQSHCHPAVALLSEWKNENIKK